MDDAAVAATAAVVAVASKVDKATTRVSGHHRKCCKGLQKASFWSLISVDGCT